MRLQRIIGDGPGQRETELFIESRRAVFGGGVERQQGARLRDRFVLRPAHQGRRDAAAPMGRVRHQLGDFGAMRLVLRQIEQQADGADENRAVEGAEHNPLAAIRRRQSALPERSRDWRVERVHET